ncbi:hypothetical protein [Phytohabitans aurantiacus]|uniref:hypothetical protein n=1 Tax=Phytohabitans aurantiacus TaxID=3016789 RepID=UPI002490C12A|nr:hypothetical protein [Phytohabitans aurantiacus]
MAGASSVTAIADWLHDLDDIARARLGFRRAVPATSTGVAAADPPGRGPARRSSTASTADPPRMVGHESLADFLVEESSPMRLSTAPATRRSSS